MKTRRGGGAPRAASWVAALAVVGCTQSLDLEGYSFSSDAGAAASGGSGSGGTDSGLGGTGGGVGGAGGGSLGGAGGGTLGDECVGRAGGEVFCSGSARISCGTGEVTLEVRECPSIQHCTLGTGADCAPCLPNQHECRGPSLYTCNLSATGFEHVRDCTGTEPCNAQAGACDSRACLPDQRRCQGDDLQLCNDDQTAFILFEACDPGLCDSVALVCDVCQAGSAGCENSSARVSCSESGEVETVADCPTATPHCVGGGNCVECSLPSDCRPDNGCFSATCSSNECRTQPLDSGEPCSFDGGQVCDGAGRCVECVESQDCASGDVCRSNACEPNLPQPLGNASTTGAADFDPPSDVMFVVSVVAPRDVTVFSLNVIGRAAGGLARLFIYDDAGGVPGNPIARSDNIGVVAGDASDGPVPALVTLSAGETYWVGAVFSGGPLLHQYPGGGTAALSIDHVFTAAPPAPFPAASAVDFGDLGFNFYLMVQDVL